MYLEPWQVFLGGCVIGTLISFIVLTVLIINVIGRIGIKGIKFSDISGSDMNDTDLVAKLSFILLARGVVTQDDLDFMTEKISFREWKDTVDITVEDIDDDKDD